MRASRTEAWRRRWLIFVAILASLTLANHYALEYAHRRLPTGRAQMMLTSPVSDTDLVVLGASPSVDAIDVDLLQKELEIDAVHLGQRGTAYPEQFLILDLFLSRQRARVLVFQVDSWGLSATSYSYPYHEYFYLPFLDNEIIRKNLLANYGWLRTACWTWVPMLKYAEFNSEMGLEAILKAYRNIRTAGRKREADAVPRSTGDHAMENFRRPVDSIRYEPDSNRLRYFERIVDLAQAHGMHVVLCFAPIYAEYAEADVHAEEVLAYYRRFAASRGIPVFECRSADLLANPACFHDPKHLNSSGKLMFSKELASFLRNELERTFQRTAAGRMTIRGVSRQDTQPQQ